MPFSGLMIKVAIWAAIVFSIIGIIWWGWSHVYNVIYDNGVNAEKKIWQKKENDDLAKHNAKVIELQEQAKLIAAAYAKYVGILETDYTKKVENGNKQKERDIADAVSGAIKLRITKTLNANRSSNGGAGKAAIAGSPSACDDSQTIELPAKITSDLYELANDADRNTDQLTAAQKVITGLQQACVSNTPIQEGVPK